VSTTTAPKRRTKTKHPGIYRSISGRYEIAYRDSDGRLKFQVAGDTLEEAKSARADVVSRLGRGEQLRSTKETFETFAESVVASVTKRPRTIEKHRYHLRRHLNPRFRHRRLTDIQTRDVARLVAEMQRAGYAGSTIAGTLSTLSLVMRKARAFVPVNPVLALDRDERPTVSSPEKRVLDEAEIAKLLQHAGDTFRPLLAFMLFTGVRIGEALGVTWGDVDFDEQAIHVRHQLDRTRARVELKTGAGRREVVLVPQLAKLLREHKLRSPFSAEADFVFCGPTGVGRDHRSTSKGIERAVARAELGDGVSAHSLRHTFASILIVGLNYDPVSVSRQLGHKNPSFTQDTYAHLFDKARHAAELRRRLDEGFGHLLDGVNAMSTDGRNAAQPQALARTAEPLYGG
jgi:integrase